MIVSKLQIRPRSRRVRLSNADMLNLDTNSPINLIAGPPLGFAYELREVRYVANIVQAYGNVGLTPALFVISGFSSEGSGIIENTLAGTEFLNVFTTVGLNVNMVTNMYVVQTGNAAGDDVDSFTDLGKTLLDFTEGVILIFNNGGAELDGGDPANYLDIFVDYNIVQVNL